MIPARSNYAGKGCISNFSLLGFVRATHILPDLVMILVENNLIVGQVVVLENVLSFLAWRVHML